MKTISFFPINSFSENELEKILETAIKNAKFYFTFSIGNTVYRVENQLVIDTIESYYSRLEIE
jgi:hypothetical protein